MKSKGQGALEYLLLIGGAILLAVVVIAILVGLGGDPSLLVASEGDCISIHLDDGTGFKTKATSETPITFSRPFLLGGSTKVLIPQNKISYIEVAPDEACGQEQEKVK